jgi:putative transposase
MSYACHYHVVWCPKYQRKVLVPPIEEQLKEIIVQVCQEHQAEIEEPGVMPDHMQWHGERRSALGYIHQLVKLIKGHSSRLLRQEFPALNRKLLTLWTNSYVVSTTGGASMSIVKQFIEQQKHVLRRRISTASTPQQSKSRS